MPKRKLHEFINNIEHKHCRSCKKWKVLKQFGKRKQSWDKKYNSCKMCVNNQVYQRTKLIVEKRKRAREEAPIGFLVCLFHSCTVKQLLQPVDQFIDKHVRNDEPTSCCLRCRNKEKEIRIRREAPCLEVWDEYRKTHPCVICMKDPNYVHNPLLIEADHLGGKVTHCSNMSYWKKKSRGVAALQAELKKCRPLCKFHHRLATQQRDRDNGRIQKRSWVLRKGSIINAEKHKRGCCSNSKCKRLVKRGEECGFDFDHRDPNTKFMYRGKTINPANFKELPQALFDAQWPMEKELVDLLCANCHKLKTHLNGDGLKT